jgi:carbonic anhydrase
VFADWRKAWWDNLEITVKLHEIKGVIGLVHRDCGAAAVAYGDQIKTDRALETARLTEALRAFRTEVKQRQSQLGVELGITDLNGAVEPVT